MARARKILSSTPHKEPHRDSESRVYCPQTGRDGHECRRFLLIPGRAQLPVSSGRAGGSRAGAGEYVDSKVKYSEPNPDISQANAGAENRKLSCSTKTLWM